MGKEQTDISKKLNKKKWGIIGAVAVVLIAFIIGISIYNMPANRLSRQLDLGNRYLEEMNYEQAIVEFDKAIAIDPMSVEAYLGKAQAYEGMGDIDMAMQTLEKGYELTGDERLLEAMQRLDPVIEWEDAAFEALIREYLGMPEGDIKESDVRDIESIIIVGIYIVMPDEEIMEWGWGSRSHNDVLFEYYYLESDKRKISEETVFGNMETLNDIKYFRSLKRLTVNYNNVSDISGLENPTDLVHLDVGFNKIGDISALSNLINLEYLSLDHNNISDISVLSGLTKLSQLYLQDNPITDYSPVSFVDELKY